MNLETPSLEGLSYALKNLDTVLPDFKWNFKWRNTCALGELWGDTNTNVITLWGMANHDFAATFISGRKTFRNLFRLRQPNASEIAIGIDHILQKQKENGSSLYWTAIRDFNLGLIADRFTLHDKKDDADVHDKDDYMVDKDKKDKNEHCLEDA